MKRLIITLVLGITMAIGALSFSASTAASIPPYPILYPYWYRPDPFDANAYYCLITICAGRGCCAVFDVPA
jgi:hypothetical protein